MNKKRFFVTFKNKKAEVIFACAYDEAVKEAIIKYGDTFKSVLPEDFPVESEFLNFVNHSFTGCSTSQERKGIIEYGQPLEPMDDEYDWTDMAETELVDGYKYLLAEREKRNRITKEACEALDVIIAFNFENKKLESDLNSIKGLLKKLNKNIK